MGHDMVTRIVMPQMGESLAEGTVVRWLKSVGDEVTVDEPLFEISTDKVDTDVPSPVAGVLREILVNDGETVVVGAAVAVVGASGDDATSSSAPAPGDASTVPEDSAGHFKATQPARLVSFQEASLAREVSDDVPADRSYSPAVLDTARRGGLPVGTLTGLTGSGRGGRLTKRDVERYLQQSGSPPGSDGVGHPDAREAATPPAYVYRPGADDRVVPMSPARQRIAHHMRWSTRISAHATAFAECDMSACAALIASRRAEVEREGDAPLTYTVLVARAVVAALAEFPTLNASVVDDSLVLKPHVHLGVAVVLPDTDDLLVPVVRGADGLALAGLARAIHDLATRARARRLTPEDVQGGTFTLTNPGMFGGLGGTPIINQPQVAILGLGAIAKRPVVVDDAIAIRPIMVMSLTFDHRAVDGVMAFKYLDRVRRHLEAAPEAPGTSGR